MANFKWIFHDFNTPDNVIPLNVNLKCGESRKIYFDGKSFEKMVNEKLAENNIINKIWTKVVDGRIHVYIYDSDPEHNKRRREKNFVCYILFGYDITSKYKENEFNLSVFIYKPWAKNNEFFRIDFPIDINKLDESFGEELSIMGKLGDHIANVILNNSEYFGKFESKL